MIGGWDISGIPTWHSGIAYSTVSSAFVAGYANDAPGIFSGTTGAIQRKVHKTPDGTLTLFADPTAAAAAFQGPIGFQIGSRNSLRGPQYFNVDFGLAKSLPSGRVRASNCSSGPMPSTSSTIPTSKFQTFPATSPTSPPAALAN